MLMKLYYLLIFVFLAGMVVMWLPQLFMGMLIFIAVLAVLGLIAWIWMKRKLKKMGLDLGGLKNPSQSPLQTELLRQMMGQQGSAGGADILSQMMRSRMSGQPQDAPEGFPRRPRAFSSPTDGPLIYVQPEELKNKKQEEIDS